MKALSHKVRVQVMSLFSDFQPRTVTQLAERLGIPKSKVHYHVRELHRAGLLQLVETRERGGVIEKFYLPVDKSLRIQKSGQGSADLALSILQKQVGRAMVDEYLEAYQNAVEHAQEQEAGGEQTERVPSTNLGVLYLTPQGRQKMQEELRDLINRWEQEYGAATHAPDEDIWQFFISMVPKFKTE
nr:helix-turn-helix domain-containing protein [Tumebacillus avium]